MSWQKTVFCPCLISFNLSRCTIWYGERGPSVLNELILNETIVARNPPKLKNRKFAGKRQRCCCERCSSRSSCSHLDNFRPKDCPVRRCVGARSNPALSASRCTQSAEKVVIRLRWLGPRLSDPEQQNTTTKRCKRCQCSLLLPRSQLYHNLRTSSLGSDCPSVCHRGGVESQSHIVDVIAAPSPSHKVTWA